MQTPSLAYAATRGQLGFDQQRLHDMVSGCAHRQELLRTDLKAGEMQILQGIMLRERLDLWTRCPPLRPASALFTLAPAGQAIIRLGPGRSR
jgi:hypothetical protein